MIPTGAYGLVNTRGLIPACIRLGTRSGFSHAFVHVGSGVIVEAATHGARASHVSAYQGREVVWNLTEAAALTPAQGKAIADHAWAQIGTPYGFTDIAALALTCLGLRWSWLTRRAQAEKRLICSQLVARSWYLGAGIDLAGGELDATVTPGALADRIIRQAGETRG